MSAVIKIGPGAPEIAERQTALRATLMAGGEKIHLPKPDGKFGEKTKAASLRFQTLKKLPQTVVYDVATAQLPPLGAAKLGVNAHKSHSAMVAPGYHLCGEPWCWGGKHTIYGADVFLEAKLTGKKLKLVTCHNGGLK